MVTVKVIETLPPPGMVKLLVALPPGTPKTGVPRVPLLLIVAGPEAPPAYTGFKLEA
jgi:hypothetical protein